MKKCLALMLVAVLIAGCFPGCAAVNTASPVSYTFQELTIRLPMAFVPLNDAFAEYDFIFGDGKVTLAGIREDRSQLQALGLASSLEEYSAQLIRAHGLDCQMLQENGITYFNYEAGEEPPFIYIVSVWETPEAFWVVQAYCLSEDYAAVKDAMWQYLSSVTL